MKVLFYHPIVPQRKDPISMDALHNKSGFSGTETALMEVGSFLAEKGHEITICGINANATHETANLHIVPLSKIHDFHDFDFFCPLFYIHSHEALHIVNKLDPKRTIIWVWMQCFVDEGAIRSTYIQRGFRVCASFLSSYVENSYNKSMFHSWTTIGNAVGSHFLTSPPSQNRQGNWMYHAVFERGGQVAGRVFQYVKQRNPDAAKQLHYASYYTHDSPRHASDIQWHASISKSKVASLLSSMDYFVYPLVLPSNSVHHDTYGSVILEALASGAIVITWNVACIPGVYGDYVVALDPKREYGYDPFARFSSNPWMNTDDAVAMLGEKILHLERNPQEKELLRQKGMAWAREQTWTTRGEAYESWLLSTLTNP